MSVSRVSFDVIPAIMQVLSRKIHPAFSLGPHSSAGCRSGAFTRFIFFCEIPQFTHIQVVAFLVNAAASGSMFARWIRLSEEARNSIWKPYGWFSGLMCCGSCFGALHSAFWTQFLIYYIQAGNYYQLGLREQEDRMQAAVSCAAPPSHLQRKKNSFDSRAGFAVG